MPIAYTRKVEFLANDLRGLNASSKSAVVDAMRGAAQRLLGIAYQLTPVDTGYMRGRWKVKNRPLGASVRNDTWYLPWVNRDSHAGFADRIAAQAPKLMREELRKIKVTSEIGRKALKAEYTRKYSSFLKHDKNQLVEYQEARLASGHRGASILRQSRRRTA